MFQRYLVKVISRKTLLMLLVTVACLQLRKLLQWIWSNAEEDESRQYKIVSPVFSSEETVSNGVCIATHCSAQHLHNVVKLSHIWKGPLFVSVFLIQEKLHEGIEEMLTLRNIHKSVKSNVTFSIVMPNREAKQEKRVIKQNYGHLNEVSSNYEKKPSSKSSNYFQSFSIKHSKRAYKLDQILYSKHSDNKEHNYKSIRRKYLSDNGKKTSEFSDNKIYSNYIHEGGFAYPNNLLRNIAINSSGCSYILTIDVDMLPSSNLREQFSKFLNAFKESSNRGSLHKKVFVLPVYELLYDTNIPEDKSGLLQLVKKNLVRPFYSAVCSKCQHPTNYSLWQSLAPESLPYEVPYRDPWEPLYIAFAERLPRFDPRFKQFGFNRISQACELHVADFEFLVLPFGFLMHCGFKERDSFHVTKREEQERNRLLFRKFKRELKLRYPNSNRRC